MYINTDEIENFPEELLPKLEKISETVLNDYYEDRLPDFTLSFVLPETIRELNRTYRDVDSVTDVLSFGSDGEIDPETLNEYLGDIIICWQKAAEQADQSGHSVGDEISLLEIHGLLHLLGYDHMTDEDHDEMWKYQDLYLDKCGIQLNRRPGEDFDF
ncbi:MAG: rRNA maturation RNase YbeY [Anaerolineaceae bacterium]|nr:rRNA maturation RNase YbeY [Anaerolineaceae bacterium]